MIVVGRVAAQAHLFFWDSGWVRWVEEKKGGLHEQLEFLYVWNGVGGWDGWIKKRPTHLSHPGGTCAIGSALSL